MQKRILLVDDEPQLLKALNAILTKKGYKVFTAGNGADALKLLEQTPVHLVISDYRMPKMTGAELFKNIKQLYPEVIRFILSGYADFDLIKESINEGYIYKFISKPWNTSSLIQSIEEAFELYTAQNNNQCVLQNGLLLSIEDLQLAIDENQFEVYYQPLVLAETGVIIGAEALLRWQHPIHGLLLPGHFISLCEASKMIIPIGIWVLRTACLQLKQWNAEGYNISVAANVSSCQFNQPGFLEVVKNIILETQIIPSNLELELTESLIMQNREYNMITLQLLRDLGLRLSLDDFGTGYSSLSYLTEFPFNTLKIDGSFVKDIITKPKILDIVTMTIALAKKLNLTTVAECVETQEQLELLKEKKCDVIQGYLFSKPISAEEFLKLLEKKLQ